jgi:hypothetical protein
MGRVVDADDADADRLGLGDRPLHPQPSGGVAEAAVAVDQRRHRRLALDPRHCVDANAAVAAPDVVARQFRDAVALDAAVIGPGDAVGRRRGVGGGNPPPLEDRGDLRPMAIETDWHGGLLLGRREILIKYIAKSNRRRPSRNGDLEAPPDAGLAA